MTFGAAEVAAIWTGGSIVGTALFWGVFLLGRLAARVERLESKHQDLAERTGGLENRMNRAGDKMSDLADEVQKIPEIVHREYARMVNRTLP